jgi:FkbM family methyltransferase
MTIGCRDSDPIPKCELAGKIIESNGELVQVMHNGLKVQAGGYYGDWMSHIIRGLEGHHEPQEELIFYHLLRYVRNSSLIVELGCFWAYYSLWYLSEVPNSTAIGIEPDSEHLIIGQCNAKLNNLSNRIQFINAWIGGQELENYSAPTENSSEPITLPMLNGDSILGISRGKEVELLHLDTQGAELHFIKSLMAATDKKLVRFVMVSTHHSSISGSTNTHFECLQQLRLLGASILIEHDVIESFSGDGLILASFYPEDANLYFPKISRNRSESSLFTDY